MAMTKQIVKLFECIPCSHAYEVIVLYMLLSNVQIEQVKIERRYCTGDVNVLAQSSNKKSSSEIALCAYHKPHCIFFLLLPSLFSVRSVYFATFSNSVGRSFVCDYFYFIYFHFFSFLFRFGLVQFHFDY